MSDEALIEDVSPERAVYGHAVASGVAWMSVVAFASKLAAFGSQLVLAWFLLEEDFGAVAIAIAVAMLFGVFNQSALSDILTQRQHRAKRWLNAGFWLSLALAGLSVLISLAAAPLVAVAFDDRSLLGLLPVAALRVFFDALRIVPIAQLQIGLRFRAIAVTGLGMTALATALSVLLALLGAGPYSLVVPFAATSAVHTLIFWSLVEREVSWPPQVNRWLSLAAPMGWLVGTSATWIVMGYGGYILLGLFHPTEVVGLYYFAFNLSTQTNQIVVVGLYTVLLAVLSKLQGDHVRQVEATLRALCALAAIAVPLCVLQALLAEPVIRLIYPDRWLPAVGVFQVLSVAMAFQLLGAPLLSLVKAQGRFRAYFIWNLAQAVAFVVAVTLAAALGEAVTVAGAMLGLYALNAPIGIWLFARPATGFVAALWQALGVPFAASAAAWMVAVGLMRCVPALHANDIARIACSASIFALVYAPLLRLLAPATWRELRLRFSALHGRILARLPWLFRRAGSMHHSS